MISGERRREREGGSEGGREERGSSKGGENKEEEERCTGRRFIHKDNVRVGEESNSGAEFSFCSSTVSHCILIRIFGEPKLLSD